MKKNIFAIAFILALFTINPTTVFGQNLNIEEEEGLEFYEVDLIYAFDELDFSFYRAYNSFLAGDKEESSSRLIEAAESVQEIAKTAKDFNQKPILKAAEKLEKLAKKVEMEEVKSAHKLRHAFAHTHHVLGKNYKLRAAGFWSKEETKKAGTALNNAAGHLGHATKWTGSKIETGAKKTGKAVGKTGKAIGKGAGKAGTASVRGVRWLAGKMVQGVAFVPEKVGQALEWLGNGLDKVGKDIEPDTKEEIAD